MRFQFCLAAESITNLEESITDLEDRLNKEKKLRKFIEANLEELKEQEQRRPGCRASSCSISSSSEDSQSSSDESESSSRDNPPLPKRKARRNHTDRFKEKSSSLSVRKLNVEKQKNDEGNSRRSVNKRQPVGRKDTTELTQTDKNGNERNLPSTLMMSSRPPYDMIEIMGAMDVLYVKIQKKHQVSLCIVLGLLSVILILEMKNMLK